MTFCVLTLKQQTECFIKFFWSKGLNLRVLNANVSAIIEFTSCTVTWIDQREWWRRDDWANNYLVSCMFQCSISLNLPVVSCSDNFNLIEVLILTAPWHHKLVMSQRYVAPWGDKVKPSAWSDYETSSNFHIIFVVLSFAHWADKLILVTWNLKSRKYSLYRKCSATESGRATLWACPRPHGSASSDRGATVVMTHVRR